MKLFVTGGSGYLGRNFIEYALNQRQDIQIKALSRSSIADAAILSAAEKVTGGKARVSLIKGDMNDELALRAGVKEVDVVVHMAAKVQPWGYYPEFERINVQGTRLLVDILAALSQPPRLIYISSFTALMFKYYPKHSLPKWGPYSKSKCLAEDIITNSSFKEAVSLRLGWIWGKDDTVLLPLLYNLQRNPMWKVTPTSFPLSIQYIINACEAVYCAVVSPSLPSRIYEFKDKEGDINVEDFVELYVKACYSLEKVSRPFDKFRFPQWMVWATMTIAESIPFLGYGRDWIFDGMNRECLSCLYCDYRLDGTKAVELGYVGKVSREEGLQESVESRKKVTT